MYLVKIYPSLDDLDVGGVRKLVGKMFLATRVAVLDSQTIAEIVYVIFNLVARLMLDLYALQETRFAISRSSRGRKSRNGPYIGGHLAFYFKLNFKQVYNVL